MYKTGDIVLFSGRCFVSRFIQLVTWCKWSHVGIVISDDKTHGIPLLYESTHGSNLTCLDIGSKTSGVRAVPLEKTIMAYNGTVAIRRVIKPDYTNRYRLRLYRTEVAGRPFEKDIKQIAGSAFIFKFLRRAGDLKSIFCSEHVSEAFKALGWMDDLKPSSWYTPRYFAKNNKYQKGVKFGKITIVNK